MNLLKENPTAKANSKTPPKPSDSTVYGNKAQNPSQVFSNFLPTKLSNKFNSSTFSTETHKSIIATALYSKALSTKKLYFLMEVAKWHMPQEIHTKGNGSMVNFKVSERTFGRRAKNTMASIEMDCEMVKAAFAMRREISTKGTGKMVKKKGLARY